MVLWREEYRKRIISAGEAVKVVKSGDKVAFTTGREPACLGLALAARKDELRDVEIFVRTPGVYFDWYDPGCEESFQVKVSFVHSVMREAMDEGRCDFRVSSLHPSYADEIPLGEDDGIDVLLTEVSPPDQHGYCSFGASLWEKKEQIKRAKTVLAEVNSSLIRTYGDNFVHFSEIDHFVESPESLWEFSPMDAYMMERREADPPEHVKRIAGHVSSLVRDGDTIQIGMGMTSQRLVTAGVFDGKKDLGFHSEIIPTGIVELVRKGVFTGERKTLHRGKAVMTGAGGRATDLAYINENPLFELYSIHYVNSIRTIAAHDNMVAVNNALAVDLTGQVASESLGHRMWSGAGGQTAFAVGATQSKGGRSIIVLPSVTEDGLISRVVAAFEPGTIVTVPRSAVDYVVTEYGIARLRGKSQRERAEQLVAIAHPDFRADLRRQAERLFWP
ncbi:MAG: acetyl-CoA hydrolase/transferase C-terminal domain-containing protein [Chloroflexota bacterium]